jgi:hypothetical protein
MSHLLPPPSYRRGYVVSNLANDGFALLRAEAIFAKGAKLDYKPVSPLPSSAAIAASDILPVL